MSGYGELAREEKWSLSELPSLAGKTAIVTGAYNPGGIGYNIAHQLFVSGAKVFIGGRTLEKALSGIEKLAASSPSSDASLLKPLVFDLGDYKEVKRVAEKLVAEEDRLDILVNNAGFASKEKAPDVDAYGISRTFGANHLGTFLFTTTLLPLLTKTAKTKGSDVRVVTVASQAHFTVPLTAKFDSLDAFNESFENLGNAEKETLNAFNPSQEDFAPIYIRYGYSKLANVLFAKELQHRLDAQGVPILALSLCPGPVATIGAAAFLDKGSELSETAMSPAEGAITPLFAAAHPEPRQEIEKYKGRFLMPWGGLKEPSPLASDETNAKQLWQTSEKILEGVFKA